VDSWKPIDTAPKEHGKRILLGCGQYTREGWWGGSHWYVNGSYNGECGRPLFDGFDRMPTHWMPMPPSPAE
jgi:hypothetical protein